MNNGQQGRRVRQRGVEQQDRCNNPSCTSLRSRFARMCGRSACLERELDAEKTRTRLLEVRLGGDGVMPGNVPRAEANGDANQQRENLHMLSERLKALGALINEWKRAQANAPKLDALVALGADLQQKMREQEEGDDWNEDLFLQWEAVDKLCREVRVELQPYVCGMCTEPLEPGKAMMGKNCYHYYCLPCVSKNALLAVQPKFEKRNDANWEFVRGIPAADPINESDTLEWRLWPGKEGTFPADYWMRCPECNEPHYCNKGYYDMVVQVLDDPIANDAADEAPQESAAATLERLRNEDRLFLLDAPGPVPQGEMQKVMLVPAKVPRTAHHPIIDDQKALSTLCSALGFRFGPVGNEGGRTYYRDKEFDDVLDELIAGATLRMTEAGTKKGRIEGRDANGRKIWYEGQVPRPGGTYKIDLPKPDDVALDAPGEDDELADA